MFPKIDSLEIHQGFLFNRKQSESGHLFQASKVQVESKNEALEIGSLQVVEPPDIHIEEVIPTVDAVGWSHTNVDIHPCLVDSSSGEARLIDSGAQISATRKRPDDQVENTIRLIAVNGSKIQSYGFRDIIVKIGRKTYKIPAIICDVAQDILGFDFVTKYKLNL